MPQRLIGLLATLGILGFVFAIPAALITMSGSPIPESWPSGQDIQDFFTTPALGSAFIGQVLFYLLWALWAAGVISLIVEIGARFRGSTTGHLKGQGLASSALTAAALLFVGLSSGVATAAPAVDTVAPITPHAAPAAASHTVDHADQTKDKVHTVKWGDTLRKIADRYYGDEMKWPKIFKANEGTVQPDGKRLTNPDHIEPSWQLTIPHTAVKATAKPDKTMKHEPANTAPSTQHETVADPDQAPAADTGRTEVAPPAVSTPAPPAPVPAAPAPVASIPAQSETTISSAAANLNGDQTTISDAAKAIGMASPIIAASIWAALRYRRRLVRKRLTANQRPPTTPPEHQDTVADLHEQANEEIKHFEVFDQALRKISQHCHDNDLTLPIARNAIVGDEQIDLVLAEDNTIELPSPWEATDLAWHWTLDLAKARQLHDHTAPAPWPTLVTVAKDAQDRAIMVNLDYARTFYVNSQDDDVLRDALAALIVELAVSYNYDPVHIATYGIGADLESALQTGNIVYSPTTDVTQLERTITATLNDRVDSTETTIPHVIVLANNISNADLTRLQALASNEEVAVITTNTPNDDHHWGLQITDDNNATLYPHNAQVTPQLLPVEVQAAIAAEIAATDPEDITDIEPEHTPSPEPQPNLEQRPDASTGTLPPPTVDITDPDTSQTQDTEGEHPRIHLLGPVRISNGVTIDSNRRNRALTLATYLATHTVTNNQDWIDALWPGRAEDNTSHQTTKYLRQMLKGARYFPNATRSKPNRLGEEVSCDWTEFVDLLNGNPTTAATANLERALQLVQGKPLDTEILDRYRWADDLRLEMRCLIADASYELATRYYEQNRWNDALTALDYGLTAEPVREQLHRLKIRVLLEAGRHDAASDAARYVETLITVDLESTLESETAQLVKQLQPIPA